MTPESNSSFERSRRSMRFLHSMRIFRLSVAATALESPLRRRQNRLALESSRAGTRRAARRALNREGIAQSSSRQIRSREIDSDAVDFCQRARYRERNISRRGVSARLAERLHGLALDGEPLRVAREELRETFHVARLGFDRLAV